MNLKKVSLVFVGLVAVPGFAATEFFSGMGAWMDPTAWDAGRLPDATNTVQVAGGAQLTFAAETATTQSVARLELGYQKDVAAAARLDLQCGTLDAKRGKGLPADSAIRFSGVGGVWAPREDVTLSVGTGAGGVSADSKGYGLPSQHLRRRGEDRSGRSCALPPLMEGSQGKRTEG